MTGARGGARKRVGSVVSVPSKAEIARAVASRAPSLIDMVKAFLVSAGASESEVNEQLRAASARPTDGEISAEVHGALVWTQLSDAIALWCRDERYIDERGRVLAIPVKGPAPSVEHLLESCVDPDLRDRARRLLQEHVDVDESGRWSYGLDDGAFRLQGDAVVERLYLAIARTLASFLFNASFAAPPERKNFDRVAAVTTFPVKMLPALRRRMHQRLAIAIRDVDNWLSQQVPAAGEPVCEVAVGAYVFTGNARPRRRAPKTTRAARPAGPTRKRKSSKQ